MLGAALAVGVSDRVRESGKWSEKLRGWWSCVSHLIAR